MKQKIDRGFQKVSGILARDFFKQIAPYFVLILLSIFLSVILINPSPPKKLVIALPGANNNHAYASIYQALLKQYDVDLEIKPALNDADSIRLLKAKEAKVDLAFIQDGIARSEGAGHLESLGSIYYEPLWILCRCSKNVRHLSELRGKRVAVGLDGDGSNILATKLLSVSGLKEKDIQLFHLNPDDAIDALKKQKIDVAMIVDISDSLLIKQALDAPGIRLVSLDDAEALVRQYSYLHHLILPESAISIANNVPDLNVHLVATTTMLVKSEDMHPALVYLMMKIIKQIHAGPGVLHAKDAFPSIEGADFPLSLQAENFYRTGPPFLDRYLPFWASTFLSRTLIVIVPLLAIFIPLSKLIPMGYNAFMRWRLFRYYGELKYLEDKIAVDKSMQQRDYYLSKLDEIELRARALKLPVTYSRYLYQLRTHIDLVRSKL